MKMKKTVGMLIAVAVSSIFLITIVVLYGELKIKKNINADCSGSEIKMDNNSIEHNEQKEYEELENEQKEHEEPEFVIIGILPEIKNETIVELVNNSMTMVQAREDIYESQADGSVVYIPGLEVASFAHFGIPVEARRSSMKNVNDVWQFKRTIFVISCMEENLIYIQKYNPGVASVTVTYYVLEKPENSWESYQICSTSHYDF